MLISPDLCPMTHAEPNLTPEFNGACFLAPYINTGSPSAV